MFVMTPLVRFVICRYENILSMLCDGRWAEGNKLVTNVVYR